MPRMGHTAQARQCQYVHQRESLTRLIISVLTIVLCAVANSTSFSSSLGCINARASHIKPEKAASRSGSDALTSGPRISRNSATFRQRSSVIAPPVPERSSCRSSAVRSARSCCGTTSARPHSSKRTSTANPKGDANERSYTTSYPHGCQRVVASRAGERQRVVASQAYREHLRAALSAPAARGQPSRIEPSAGT
jgi:hypothetical protein